MDTPTAVQGRGPFDRPVAVYVAAKNGYNSLKRRYARISWWLRCTRNFISFFIIGTINNLAYVVANSAAQDIVKKFGTSQYIGIIPWANVAFGFFVRTINAFFLAGVPYKLRIFVNSVCMLLGLLIVAYSVYFNFVVCVFGIILIGMSSSFGENVILGFLKDFPPDLITGWSSGTGLAGVLGSALYLLYDAIGFDMTTSFLVTSYFVSIYMAVFFFGVVKGKENPYINRDGEIDDEHEDAAGYEEDEERVEVRSSGEDVPDHISSDEFEELLPKVQPGEKLPLGRKFLGFLKLIWFCVKHVWWRSFNLGAVYFFEYVISVMGADKAEPPGSRSSSYWPLSHSYIILAFCYQIGVFISRSSLKVYKVKRIEILTFLQFVNFLLWIIIDIYKFEFLGVWIQFIFMIYVGLLGGCSYVNVFYLVLNDEKLNNKERELSVNIVALSINAGITVASLFMLVMDSTILLNK